ncbi:NADP-dependent oxidoreductase [Geodermatophilus sp. DF01-2]|uniref:quinone oxidoreductase family protein n=1 Tax=Geodermatophilus sp. DF01-2 TaxID=2559610 RepID=UPI001073A789|nr:NADP-dependent oxidoreductase [Geodermatophilus sp. DF01_2]TFV58569.1 NADP-dependent oxidoreductase [Geodermatophilus sp. DF01_2]
MTRVVLATAYGGPEVLAVVDEPVGDPGPGQARIGVRAAGVNPADWKSYTGAFGSDPGRLPKRLGFEVSGVVTAVGPDAVGPAGPLSVGAEVVGFRVSGGYAAELVVPTAALVPKPASLGWEQAAGLMLTGATAVHALTATGVGAGGTVLVHGAAGGVGLMAVQLAGLRGARVVGTVGGDGAELVRRFGAEPVRYGDGLADRVRAAAPGGVDAAVDLVGTDEAVDVSLELVADRRRIATIAAFGRAAADGIQALGGGPGADPGAELRDAARLELAEAAGAGRLEVVVAGTFPLEEVAAAHRQGMAGHTHGKLVLVP